MTNTVFDIDSGEAASPLISVLEQNAGVKERVEACAVELGVINEFAKTAIDSDAPSSPSPEVLAAHEQIKDKVQECADDLSQVNQALTREIDNVKRIEARLGASQEALEVHKTALLVSEEKEKAAQKMAMHDPLTQLPNRRLFDDRLVHAISLAERHDWVLVIMFLDLDSFKGINDSLGHAAGDVVLKEVADRLLRHSRDEDTVCRGGGDEFLCLLVDFPDRTKIREVATRISNSIAQPIGIGDQQLIVRSSIGIAIYPDDGIRGDELLNNADAAMYRAKSNGDDWHFFGSVGERGLP